MANTTYSFIIGAATGAAAVVLASGDATPMQWAIAALAAVGATWAGDHVVTERNHGDDA